MNKLTNLLPILVFNLFNIPVFAEVNLDLLKQKYPKCKDSTYRHECFDDYKYSLVRKVGYFIKNSLWDGLHYQENILIAEFKKGKMISKSFCKINKSDWSICPSGNKFKPIENGYYDNNNNRQGNFIYKYKDGSVYIGNYKDGRRHGKGTFTWENGNKYKGNWQNGKMSGIGTYIWKNGIKDVGEFKNGALNGFAIRYDEKGKILKEGIWKDDKFLYAKKESISRDLNSKLDKYKRFCETIGFTLGTEKFAECVVEAMKKG